MLMMELMSEALPMLAQFKPQVGGSRPACGRVAAACRASKQLVGPAGWLLRSSR